MASMRKGAAAQELVAMELQNGPGTRMSALIDAADAKRRCFDGGVPGCSRGCAVEGAKRSTV